MMSSRYSPDGRWWWDGQRWLPVAPAAARPPAPAPGSHRRLRPPWLLLATYALVVVLAAAGSAAANAARLRARLREAAVPTAPAEMATAPPPGASAVPAADSARAGAPLDPAAIQRLLAPSIVNLRTEYAYGLTGTGTGLGIVVSASGLVLTTEDNVFEARSILAFTSQGDEATTARLVGTDLTADLALLQLESTRGVAPARFGAPAGTVGPALRDPVLVLGVNQFGPTVSRGSVTEAFSATNVDGAGDWPGAADLRTFTFDGVPTNDDAVGPVTDPSGRVIGWLEALNKGGNGYAITAVDALYSAGNMAAGRSDERFSAGLLGTLGVVTRDVGQYLPGARVTAIQFGTSGQCLGLVPGDVIDAVDGNVISSAVDLRLTMVQYRPGTRVTVRWTDARRLQHTATVTLTAGTGP
jgi:putative serine protease PepD